MRKSPITSAVLWFFGVSLLTGSGFLGMIAAVFAYNSAVSKLADEEYELRNRQRQQSFNPWRKATGMQQGNPWQQSSQGGYSDVDFQTQSYEERTASLRPDDKYVEFEAAETKPSDKAENKKESEIEAQAKKYLASLRLAKASIDSKAIQEKITDVEKLVGNIYARVGEKPEQTSAVKEIIDKTMPMTTSVLESYAEMNVRKIQSKEYANMEKSVNDLLDKTKQAYTKLYDDMYDGDIMDITSEIDVLKTILSQEGLLDDGIDISAKKKKKEKNEGEMKRQTQ